MSKPQDREFTEEESAKRRDAALKRMLTTPHKPHKPLKKKKAAKKAKPGR